MMYTVYNDQLSRRDFVLTLECCTQYTIPCPKAQIALKAAYRFRYSKHIIVALERQH